MNQNSNNTILYLHCLKVIQKCFTKYFQNPVYVLSLALHPSYKELAVSKFYTSKNLRPLLGHFLKKLGVPLATANNVLYGFGNYLSGNDFVNHSFAKCDHIGPYKWWEEIQVKSKNVRVVELSKIALKLFGITPHAADTERLFSILGNNHTKTRNCLSVNTLKQIGQLKREYTECRMQDKQNNELNNGTYPTKKKRKGRWHDSDKSVTQDDDSALILTNGTAAESHAVVPVMNEHWLDEDVGFMDHLSTEATDAYVQSILDIMDDVLERDVLTVENIPNNDVMELKIEDLFDLDHPLLCLTDKNNLNDKTANIDNENAQVVQSDIYDWTLDNLDDEN